MNEDLPLPERDDVIEVLEKDLRRHCIDALEGNDIEAYVNGVFSLDDLEAQIKADNLGRIGVGIAYSGSATREESLKSGNPTGDGAKAIMTEMMFMILLAAPVDRMLTQRITATQLLTVLKRGILGKRVETGSKFLQGRGDTSKQRPWLFVQEKPEIAESTPTMLYYTQVWRLVMPVSGN
jgi:hypothetical protein